MSRSIRAVYGLARCCVVVYGPFGGPRSAPSKSAARRSTWATSSASSPVTLPSVHVSVTSWHAVWPHASAPPQPKEAESLLLLRRQPDLARPQLPPPEVPSAGSR